MDSSTCHRQIEFFHDCGHQVVSTIQIHGCPRFKKINRRPKANKTAAECLGTSAERCYLSTSCTNCGGVEGAATQFGNNTEVADCRKDNFSKLVLARRRLAFRLSMTSRKMATEVQKLAPVAHFTAELLKVSSPKASSKVNNPSETPSEVLAECRTSTTSTSQKSYQTALSDESPEPRKQSEPTKAVLTIKRTFANTQAQTATEGKTMNPGKKTFKKTTVSLPSAGKVKSKRFHGFDGCVNDDDDEDSDGDDDVVVSDEEDPFAHKHVGAQFTANPRKKGARERLG